MSLEAEMRSVLAQLELLSHGKCQSFNAMSRGENDNPRPFGEANPPHIVFRERWAAAPAHKRPGIVVEARDELRAARKGPQERPEGETAEQLRVRIVKDGEGLNLQEAALQFRCTESTVRKARAQAKDPMRDREFGKPFQEPKTVDKTERVLYLLGKDMSVRAVAAQVGMQATQVQRIKKRAA